MILKRKPRQLWKCTDGTYSTHNRRGACMWHGGLRSDKPVPLSAGRQAAGVDLIAISEIHVNHEWFQNRATPFSARSVENIISAVEGGNFNWANFDAVTLWRGPKGQLFILSGHSRTEAFRQLCEMGLTAGGRDFCRIPAKIATGLSLPEAKQIAQESNTLATQETPLERAAYYRKMRSEGATTKQVEERAKRLEGRNANTVVAFSYLSLAGRTLTALQALENGQADSQNVLAQVGRWIGNARKQNAELTDFHEDELYIWLIQNGGYGRNKGQVKSEAEFKTRLASIINRRTEFGELATSLNIKNFITKSPVEQQYDQRIEEAKKAVLSAEKELKAKLRELVSRGATESDVQRISEPLERQLRRQRLALQTLLQKRSEVEEAARNELNLFASLQGIKIYV